MAAASLSLGNSITHDAAVQAGRRKINVEAFTPSRYWFVEGVDGPWEWRMELARRGVVAYGKLFSKKAGLVSREWYPNLANYRRDGYDFDARYEEGLASRREKCVMDVLLREGPTLSKDLKRLAGFGGDGLKGFDSMITREPLKLHPVFRRALQGSKNPIRHPPPMNTGSYLVTGM